MKPQNAAPRFFSKMFSKLLSDPLTTPYTDERRAFGDRGEKLAAAYLKDIGLRLVLSNFKVPVGRNRKGVQVSGEIDLIALDGDTLCFIEIKTRRSRELFDPIAAVTARKQRQIIRAAKVYRRIFGVFHMPIRYDVVTVVVGGDEVAIEHVKGFWTEEKFRKRRWSHESWQDFS